MTGILFAGDWLGMLAAGLACYAGVLLYGALLSLFLEAPNPPAVARGIGALLGLAVIFYLAMFPVPAPEARLVLVLTLAWHVTGTILGPVALALALAAYREGRAYETGAPAARPGAGMQTLIFAPAVLVVGYSLIGAAWLGEPVPPILGHDPAAWTPRASAFFKVRNAVGLGYIASAALLGLAHLRVYRGIRLSEIVRWILRVVLVIAALGLVRTALVPAEELFSRASVLWIAALWLVPGFIVLRQLYDAVLRRILTFHVLVAAAGGIVFGGGAVVEWLGMRPPASWVLGLTAVSVAAIALPARVDRWLERRLFPRAAAVRARLAAVASAPPATTTRAEAGEELIRHVVEALDSEGGAIVVAATAVEPATVRAIGAVDPQPLGATADETAQYVGGLPLGGAPRHIDALPLADRLRVGRCDVELVCPLVARRTEATLLLGRRRGWLYDAGTVQALRQFASQAGLALENLTLVTARLTAERARAHAEKLAAIGETAARIAHDIRNPVTAARSLAQQLAREPSAPHGAELAVILGELERVERQVATLLRFARREELRLETVDLAELVRDTVEGCRPRLGSAGVEVALQLGAGVTTRADREKLRQVLINLIENAVDALAETPDRRLSLAVSGTNGAAVVRVTDNGPAVPADALPRLFEPFFSLKEHGTGLGLAIARRTVEAHGGRIAAERGPVAGMTFHIELPLAEEWR